MGDGVSGIVVTTPPTIGLPSGSVSGSPTLPPITYQYAVTDVPQTWSALQTFRGGVTIGTAADPGVGGLGASGSIKSSSATAGVGYATGAGNTVTQATSKSTGVTLNNICGAITMNGAILASGAAASFTLTNSTIAATDVVMIAIKSGATAGAYRPVVDSIAAGSCQISITNGSGGSLSEAVVINFCVIKAVAT